MPENPIRQIERNYRDIERYRESGQQKFQETDKDLKKEGAAIAQYCINRLTEERVAKALLGETNSLTILYFRVPNLSFQESASIVLKATGEKDYGLCLSARRYSSWMEKSDPVLVACDSASGYQPWHYPSSQYDKNAYDAERPFYAKDVLIWEDFSLLYNLVDRTAILLQNAVDKIHLEKEEQQRKAQLVDQLHERAAHFPQVPEF